MVKYEVTVFTGNLTFAGTLNNVYIKMVGTDGESHHTHLIDIRGALAFSTGAVSLIFPSSGQINIIPPLWVKAH